MKIIEVSGPVLPNPDLIVADAMRISRRYIVSLPPVQKNAMETLVRYLKAFMSKRVNEGVAEDFKKLWASKLAGIAGLKDALGGLYKELHAAAMGDLKEDRTTAAFVGGLLGIGIAYSNFLFGGLLATPLSWWISSIAAAISSVIPTLTMFIVALVAFVILCFIVDKALQTFKRYVRSWFDAARNGPVAIPKGAGNTEDSGNERPADEVPGVAEPPPGTQPKPKVPKPKKPKVPKPKKPKKPKKLRAK